MRDGLRRGHPSRECAIELFLPLGPSSDFSTLSPYSFGDESGGVLGVVVLPYPGPEVEGSDDGIPQSAIGMRPHGMHRL